MAYRSTVNSIVLLSYKDMLVAWQLDLPAINDVLVIRYYGAVVKVKVLYRQYTFNEKTELVNLVIITDNV